MKKFNIMNIRNKSKALIVLLTLFVLANIIDLYTALQGDLLVSETNPVFLTFGIGIAVAFKILFVMFIFSLGIFAAFPTRTSHFFFVLIVVLATFVVILGAASNIYAANDLASQEAAQDMTNQDKMTYYFTVQSIVFIIPTMLCFLSFKIYEWSQGAITYSQQQVIVIDKPKPPKT